MRTSIPPADRTEFHFDPGFKRWNAKARYQITASWEGPSSAPGSPFFWSMTGLRQTPEGLWVYSGSNDKSGELINTIDEFKEVAAECALALKSWGEECLRERLLL